MASPNLVCALALVFITGMVWLRTRMHYRGAGPRLRLTRAGWIYFAVLLAVLSAGWLVAPSVARALWPNPMDTALLARVAWFLLTYYLFIPAHRALHAQGVAVFKSVADVPELG